MLQICNRQLSRRAEQEEIKNCEVNVWLRKKVNVVGLASGILTRCVATEIADLEQISVRNIKFAKSGKEI